MPINLDHQIPALILFRSKKGHTVVSLMIGLIAMRELAFIWHLCHRGQCDRCPAPLS